MPLQFHRPPKAGGRCCILSRHGRSRGRPGDEADANDTYDYYYNTSWQVVEIHKNSSVWPFKRYIWDARYIDAPICRRRRWNLYGAIWPGA